MHRFRNASKFRIGDGLAQFEFSLRQTTLEHNTDKINVINLSKAVESRAPKSENKNKTKKTFDYDPRRADINDMIDSLQDVDEKDSNISAEDINNNVLLNQEIGSRFEVHPPSSPYHYTPLAARSNKNVKSKSHNFSRYDRLNNKSNIRKKKNIEDNFNQTLSLSSFRAPEQLRQLMLSFTHLEYIVRDFLRNNQYYTQFAKKWKYFSDSFEHFIETASLHFSSNFNYNSSSQCLYRQITKTTPVYLTSEIIVNNFSEFIQQSKEIQSHSSKLIHSIQKEFGKIHRLIQKTRNSMTQNRYRTDVPCIKLEEFQNNVISLNEELFPKNFLNDPSNIELNLNKKRLHKQICELNREVFEIFHKFLKYSFINLAVKIQIRTDLSSCISNIEESLLVAERIRYFAENLRNSVYKTNKELTNVLNLMGFPYHIDMDEMNQSGDSKGVVYKKEAGKAKVDLNDEKEFVKHTNTVVNEIESLDDVDESAANNENDGEHKLIINDVVNEEEESINGFNNQTLNEEESINNENNREVNLEESGKDVNYQALNGEEESINGENNNHVLNEDESINDANNQEVNVEESISNENNQILNEEKSINNGDNQEVNEEESINCENAQEVESLNNEEVKTVDSIKNEEEPINDANNQEVHTEESNENANANSATNESDFVNSTKNEIELSEGVVNHSDSNKEPADSLNNEVGLALKPLNNDDDLLNYFDELTNGQNTISNDGGGDDDLLSGFDEIGNNSNKDNELEIAQNDDNELLNKNDLLDSANSDDEHESNADDK